MAIQIRGSVTNSGDGGSPRTVAKPTGVAAGDLLLLFVGRTASGAPTPPSGFDPVQTRAATSGTDPGAYLYAKVAGGSEPSDYSVTFSGGNAHAIMLALYSDVPLELAIDVSNQRDNAATNRVWNSLNAAQAGEFLCCFAVVGATSGTTPPGGSDERYDSGTSPRVYLMTETVASAGATGTRTGTGLAGSNTCIAALVLESAAADLTEPSDLAAAPVSPTRIDLTWTDTASGEHGWKVERSPAGDEDWTQIAAIAAESTSYSATGLTPATAYDFRVRAYAGETNGDYSNTATAATYPQLSAPYAVVATGAGATAIVLTWQSDDDPGGFDAFHVERSPTGAGDWAEIDTTASDVYAYEDTGLTPGTTYWYRVRAGIA